MTILNHLVKSFLSMIFFFVILFIAAGTINYLQGWIYFALSIFGLVINVVTTQNNPELIREWLKPGDNIQSWDKKILGCSSIGGIKNELDRWGISGKR